MIRSSNYIFIGIIIVLITGLIIFQRTTQIKYNFQGTSIENIAELYWTASLNGDSTLIKQISTHPPENMFQNCVGNKKNELTNPQENSGSVKSIKDNADNNFKDIAHDAKQNPFTDESIEGDINATSEFIYYSKTSFKRVKIVEKKVYQDQALLEVKIADYRGDFAKSNTLIFFFRNENQSWKLVGIGDKDLLLSISGTINYAIPKRACE